MKKIILLFLISFVAGCGDDTSFHVISDQEASDYVKRHKVELESLVRNIKELPQLERVRLVSGNFEMLPKGFAIPKELSQAMTKAELGLIDVRMDEGKLKYVEFILSASGSVLSGEIKGILYTPTTLSDNIYEDLDELRENALSSKAQESIVGYKQLSQKWYVFYSIDF